MNIEIMQLDDRETMIDSIEMGYEMDFNFIPTPDLDIYFENGDILFSVERVTYMVDNDEFFVKLKNQAYPSQEFLNIIHNMKKIGWIDL